MLNLRKKRRIQQCENEKITHPSCKIFENFNYTFGEHKEIKREERDGFKKTCAQIA